MRDEGVGVTNGPEVEGANTVIVLADAAATERLGRRLAGIVRAGDLIVLSGELGAGKTTFVRGLGDGLGIRGPVTSPTFVIARRHPPVDPQRPDGLHLIHVDAYRVETAQQIDDLDLMDRLDDAVTVVEWGAGKVEHLSESRLHIDLREPPDDGDRRVATIRGVGPRWSPELLDRLVSGEDTGSGRGSDPTDDGGRSASA